MKKIYRLIVYVWNENKKCWYKFTTGIFFKKRDLQKSIEWREEKMGKHFPYYKYKYKQEVYQRTK